MYLTSPFLSKIEPFHISYIHSGSYLNFFYKYSFCKLCFIISKTSHIFNAVPTTDWGSPETLEYWREQWAALCNAKLGVKEGDVIAKGQVLGNVAEPTSYFSEEGSHLYFALTKDDVPVDPSGYFEK